MYNRQKFCEMFFLVKGRKSSFYKIIAVKEFVNFCGYIDFRNVLVFPLGRLRGNYYV